MKNRPICFLWVHDTFGGRFRGYTGVAGVRHGWRG